MTKESKQISLGVEDGEELEEGNDQLDDNNTYVVNNYNFSAKKNKQLFCYSKGKKFTHGARDCQLGKVMICTANGNWQHHNETC